MSKDTGARRILSDEFTPLFKDVFELKEHVAEVKDPGPAYAIAKVYKIAVTIGNECIVTDDLSANTSVALEHAVERTKRAIVEAVFGEFRQDFYMIETALYDRDFHRARAHLTEFQRKMYEV
jgi:hypothetical protein